MHILLIGHTRADMGMLSVLCKLIKDEIHAYIHFAIIITIDILIIGFS